MSNSFQTYESLPSSGHCTFLHHNENIASATCAATGPNHPRQRPATAQQITPVHNQNSSQQQTIQLNLNGQRVTANLQYVVRQEYEEQARVVTHASFLIDASGSMKSKVVGGDLSCFDMVMQYMKKLMQDVLLPTDLLTVAFFHNTYKEVRGTITERHSLVNRHGVHAEPCGNVASCGFVKA